MKMEFKARIVSVHGKDCIGCKKHKAAIMLSIREEEKSQFIDIFFDKEQVEILKTGIDLHLKFNRNEGTEDGKTDMVDKSNKT